MFVGMLRPSNAILIAFATTACGGSGGPGPTPLANELRLTISDATLPATATTGDLTVSLAEHTPELAPALLQFDLAIDPPIVSVAAGSPLTAIQNIETLDGDFVEGGFRIICGYGESPDAQQLSSGALFRIALQASTPRVAGAATVTMTGLRVVDGQGEQVPLDSGPITAAITVQ